MRAIEGIIPSQHPAYLSFALQRGFKSGDELSETDAERLTEDAEFHHINAPLTPLDFADKGLSFADARGYIDLRQAGTFSGIAQDLQKYGVLLTVDGLPHWAGAAMLTL